MDFAQLSSSTNLKRAVEEKKKTNLSTQRIQFGTKLDNHRAIHTKGENDSVHVTVIFR